MANGMNGLRTLMGLQGPSNFQNVANAGSRAVDAFSSEADLMPSEEELKGVQRAVRGSQRTPGFQADPGADATTNFSNELQAQAGGGVQMGVSRRQVHDAGMSGLRQQLGLAQRETDREADAASGLMEQEHGHAMERQQAGLENNLEAARIAAGSRERIAGQDADLSREAMELERVLGLAKLQGQQPGQKTRLLPQGLLKGIADAEADYNSQWFGEPDQLTSMLEAAMEYQGGVDINALRGQIAQAKQQGMTGGQLLAAAASVGEPVSELERKYIIAQLGE